ncbi:hypothetical protein RI138_16180 [Streptomyces sp. C11-1]|uniref:DUF4352 domain-containing protein n=1 Tax=Streptomyces durocortorensis TaxID=2811104 RepID=A0ABY9VWH9_9ACTN|nr:hypothetical protein [Streptomyces durocortorensis]WNF28250.1 hypothetical protein RI138_16180 [Streptomyces durocortorensis]
MSSRGSTFAALGAALALLALPACGAASIGTGSSPGSAVPAAATSSPDAGAPPGAEILGTSSIGEPFKLTIDSTNEARPDEFEITVEDVTCGEPLDPKVLAHDSPSAPTAPPTPEDGKQFCVVSMEVLNVGKGEARWTADDTVTLNVDDTAYSQTRSDAQLTSAYEEYWYDQGEPRPSFGLNPASKGPVNAVFQIPAADEPTTLWFAAARWLKLFDPEPGYLIQLQPPDQR